MVLFRDRVGARGSNKNLEILGQKLLGYTARIWGKSLPGLLSKAHDNCINDEGSITMDGNGGCLTYTVLRI